ncbi:MAG: hypothetical protein ACOZAM_18345 [Pseudomonadota bacterium]
MRRWYAALVLTAVLTGSAMAAEWRTYVNERFGAAADIPADYREGEAPTNDDGRRFTSPEGDATIAVWGSLASLEGESFQQYAEQLIGYDKEDGWEISYTAGKQDWYAFSGTKGDQIVFEKLIQACDGQIANHVRLEYPASRKAAFDAIVSHVTKSLRSEKGWQC